MYQNVFDWIYEIRNAVLNGGLGGGNTTKNAKTVFVDQTGVYEFAPDSCSQTITYNANGDILTETYIDPLSGYQFIRTYGYNVNNQLVTVSAWVKL